MNRAINTVSATMSMTAWPPTSDMVLSDDFIPTAAMAINSAQRETSPKNVDTLSGIRPMEFIPAKTRNAITKPGISGGLPAE